MSRELEDEITSINSIYGENTLVQVSTDPVVLALTFPSQSTISLRVEFTTKYPDVPPSILGPQSVGSDVAKGEGKFLAELVRDVLPEVYLPGAPCIFDLVEEVELRLQKLGLEEGRRKPDRATAAMGGQQDVSHVDEKLHVHAENQLEELNEEPPWTLSEVVNEKKSVFVSRCAPVNSVEQARQYLAHLLASDKKAAKATHNITAWRIRGENGVQYQDCDDDGESAAGARLLHLLELMGVWNAMVVVSRWYGGIHLGPDRFRIINQTARDALVKAGFAQDAAKDGNKRKGK